MLRRAFVPNTARVAQQPTIAFPQLSTAQRTYFSPGTGEQGIWGENLRRLTNLLAFSCFIGGPFFLYKTIFRKYNPDKQWVAMSTDKWYSDGTVMHGAEATANLRIQHERIMPIMDQYLAKIEASNQEA